MNAAEDAFTPTHDARSIGYRCQPGLRPRGPEVKSGSWLFRPNQAYSEAIQLKFNAGQDEVYKVYHHASAYSTNERWLKRTTPVVGIVTVGDGNTYGHPTQPCLERLHAAGVKTYWTERGKGVSPVRDLVAGDVLVQSDGTAFNVISTARTDSYLTWEAASGPTITCSRCCESTSTPGPFGI